MSITRKLATSIVGAIAGLAGLTLVLVSNENAEPSQQSPEPETSQVADLTNNQINGDFPWN